MIISIGTGFDHLLTVLFNSGELIFCKLEIYLFQRGNLYLLNLDVHKL